MPVLVELDDGCRRPPLAGAGSRRSFDRLERSRSRARVEKRVRRLADRGRRACDARSSTRRASASATSLAARDRGRHRSQPGLFDRRAERDASRLVRRRPREAERDAAAPARRRSRRPRRSRRSRRGCCSCSCRSRCCPGSTAICSSGAFVEQQLSATASRPVPRTPISARRTLRRAGVAAAPRSVRRRRRARCCSRRRRCSRRLGFEPAGAIEPADPAIAATLRSRRPHGGAARRRRGAKRLDPLWRLGGDAGGAPVAPRGACSSTASTCGSSTPAGSTRGVISSSISISRSTTRGVRRAAAPVRRAGARAPARTIRDRCTRWSPHPIATPPASADRCATACSRRRPTSCARSSPASPRRRTASTGGNGRANRRRRRQLRAGADDRLSHPVPAVRRSARARAAVASRSTARATASRRCATRPSSRRRRPGSGTRCAPSPAWRTPAAAPATCG